ncbi:hypothetical protein ACP70R_024725 [Stipagrostis hirtigluma subsp. patula]
MACHYNPAWGCRRRRLPPVMTAAPAARGGEEFRDGHHPATFPMAYSPSQRLIDGERGQNLEEAGETYFNELINRSLKQPVDIHYDGRAHACRVHDVLLYNMVSMSDEANFITIPNGDEAKRKLLLVSNGDDSIGNPADKF